MATATLDLRALAEQDCLVPIPPEQFLPAISGAPFVPVPGTFNMRDIGLPATTVAAADAPSPKYTRPGFVFRAGSLDTITQEGKSMLTGELGVRRIFDLRSASERKRAPQPDVPGAEISWVETAERDAMADLSIFVDGEGEKGYVIMYMDVLDTYKKPYKLVLEHVRDRPEEPFLFHCTAGRDRTGVLAGLLETLAGDTPSEVAFEYLLSRIGSEPAREMLIAFAMRGTGATSMDAPGFSNMCNLRASSWAAFMGAVDQTYGGFEGYVRNTLGFGDADVQRIKENLRKK